jgi:hypothetical protein
VPYSTYAAYSAVGPISASIEPNRPSPVTVVEMRARRLPVSTGQKALASFSMSYAVFRIAREAFAPTLAA